MTTFRHLAFALLGLAAGAGPLRAQQLFTTDGYLVPIYRGTSGTEYSRWENFFSPYLDPNAADIVSAASDPAIAQVLAPSAFITSGLNIYTPAEKIGMHQEREFDNPRNRGIRTCLYTLERPGGGEDA